MDEMMYTNLLKTIGLVAGATGILMGLDLIFGAPVVTFLKRIFDKGFDFDKLIVNPNIKRGLGVVFLALALIIILLLKRV